MHPECPDYDLCENCEAFPIAVHPGNHPMLKMKTPHTVVPTVYRVGQTRVIEPTAVDNERQTFIDTPKSPESTPSGIAREASPPTPSVPVPVIRSCARVEDDTMRYGTPVARSIFDHAVCEKVEARSNQNQVEHCPRSPPSPPRPPKLPPKPDMISHQSWASIPGFFNPASSNAFPPLPGNNAVSESQVVSERNDTLLPKVPNHTPNSWPTTNSTETEELLKLITEFSGPSVPAPPMYSLAPASPVSCSKTRERPAATPSRNNPFLTPPSTAVELSRAIPSLVEQPTAFESHESLPSASDPLPIWASLTPDATHLVRENLERPAETRPASVVGEPASIVSSPLSGQVLLNRPTSSGSAVSSSYPRSLSDLIDQLPALVPSKILSLEKLPEAREALSAKFLYDVTVSDGQVFPPGAEFVKCWRLLNTSERDLPENTELVFVAGDPLSASALPPVLIGQVAAGAEFDVWTGELKVCLTNVWY